MQLNLSSSFRRSLKRGSRIIVLITDNQASKLAFKLAKGILHPQDELQLVTVVMGEESLEYGSRLLAPLLPSEQQQQQNGPTISPVVLLKGDDRLADVISQYCKDSCADLLITGSQNLCVEGLRDDPLPATGSFAMRLVKNVRTCPVLVVKANSKGPYIRATSAAAGLKVMVECRSTSRRMLTWLMDQMDPDKDSIFLAVTKAQEEGTGRVKDTATRMLTNFSVQAGTNDFYTAQRLFKDPGVKALPQAVEADAIDILAVQAPDCKQLPEAMLDLLQTARTSLLIFNNKQDEDPLAEAVGGALRPDPSAAAMAQAAGLGI